MSQRFSSGFFAVLVVFQLIHAASNAQEREEASLALLQPMVFNAEAWRQYDCLIRFEQFDDRDASSQVRLELTRFTVDWDAAKVRCIVDSSKSEFENDKDQKKSKVMHARMHDGERSGMVVFPNPVRHQPHPLGVLLRDSQVADIRIIGIADFPTPFKLQSRGFEGWKAKIRRKEPDLKIQVKQLDDKLLLNSRVLVGGSQSEFVNVSYLIDSRTQLVEEFKRSFQNPLVNNGEPYGKIWQSIKWKEINHCFVPVEAIMNEEKLDEKGKVHSQPSFLKIHWFSLNEPLAPDLFQLDRLNDFQRLTELVDPKKSGATSLDDGS